MILGRYCACEILIANPIDWLYAACLEYFIFFSIDSSEARKQYDEYCHILFCFIYFDNLVKYFSGARLRWCLIS